jgi:hypothetical protein
MAQGSEQADEAIARLKQVLAAAEREVQRLLRRLDTQPGSSRLASDALSLQNNRAVVQQVRRAIAEVRQQVLELGANAAAAAAMASATPQMTFAPQTATLLKVIVDDRMRELGEMFTAADEAVARAARITLATSADVTGLVDEVARVFGSTRSQAASAVDSMAMAAGRQMTLLDSEMAARANGVEMVYGYGGPIDSIARPFCREHHTRLTEQVYTLEALNRLDNGAHQPKPVSVYLGGYNCRHNLQPMTRDEAKSRGLRVIE